MEDIKLIDLIDREALQKIQDGFSAYTGMAAVTTDVDGVPVTKDSGFTRFCNELTRKSELGCRNCEKCDRDGAFRTLEEGKAAAYVCHAGLMDFAAPIILDDKVIGGFIGGQVRIREIDEEEIIAKAIEYGIDPDEYVKASNETSLLTKESVEKAAKFIEEIASGLSLMAYKSYQELSESERMGRVAQSQADYVMNMSMSLEHSMERWLRTIDNAMSRSSNTEVYNLLSLVVGDGQTTIDNVKETISYIKMSADKIEISEAEYGIFQLMNMLAEMDRDNVSVTTGRLDHEILFGDVVQIGQMFIRIVKDIMKRSGGCRLDVKLSTIREKYVTFLSVEIMERKTKISADKIQKINDYLNRIIQDAFVEASEVEAGLFLEGTLLRNMSATAAINRINDDLVMTVNIPQIGL